MKTLLTLLIGAGGAFGIAWVAGRVRRAMVRYRHLVERDSWSRKRGMVGLGEVVCQPLYDTVRIDRSGRFHAFHTPVGQGSSVFGHGAKHFGDTNMYLAAQLPAGNSFRIRGVFVEIVGDPEAVPAWIAGAAVELVMGSKRYLVVPVTRTSEIPLDDLNALEICGLTDLLKDVDPSGHAMLLGSLPGIHLGFELEDSELVIPANTNFGVDIILPEYVAPTPQTPLTLRVYLNGHQFRPVC